MTRNAPKTGKYTEDDPVKIDLKTVCDYFYEEDLSVRQIQVRYWKRLKYYWNNFSQIFWSERDGSYIIPGRDSVDGTGSTDQSYYDRPVNVFKAFLETIVAALSVNIPSVSCMPDDADNPNDLTTAKAGNKISELLYRRNNAIFLWLHALYIYCTEGLIACYTYEDTDESYGTYEKKDYKDEEVNGYFCPSCKRQLDEEMVGAAKEIEERLKDKFDPNEEDVDLLQEYEYEDDKPISLNEDELLEPVVCPECSVAINGNLAKSTLIIPKFVGITNHPKSRLCMEVYGGLYVKVANYAKKQADTPYLAFMYDTHYANVLESHPDLWDKIDKGGWASNQGNDPIEQYSRLNIQYRGEVPKDNVTVKNFWLRPAAFNVLGTKEKANEMKRKYPNGCRVTIVQDIIADHCAESLDDHWTLTQNPTSDYLNHEPLGEVLVNIQDIINDLISLTLQLIEHGIPENWVDPSVVDVPAIGQREVVPGAYSPTKQVLGNKSIKDAFHSTTAAAMPPELFTFYKIVNELGQFVSGAMPSIFGGALPNSGDTASEYKESQRMGLQRLQTPWKMLTIWWKAIMGKAIPAYMKMIVEDEKFVKKDQQGNFINVFIRKSELSGKIGDVELDNSDQLPITEEQQAEVIRELMSLNNMEVFEALAAPENLPFIRKIVRIPQFKLPGEDDRQKQYEEIQELINSVPIPMGNQEMGMGGVEGELPIEDEESQQIDSPTGGFTSSIPVDIILDNHKVEAEICRNWLVGDAGRLAKVENPDGYANVLLHFQEHTTEYNKQVQMMQMSQASQNPQEETTGQSPKDKTNNPSGSKTQKPEKSKGVQ